MILRYCRDTFSWHSFLQFYRQLEVWIWKNIFVFSYYLYIVLIWHNFNWYGLVWLWYGSMYLFVEFFQQPTKNLDEGIRRWKILDAHICITWFGCRWMSGNKHVSIIAMMNQLKTELYVLQLQTHYFDDSYSYLLALQICNSACLWWH